MLRLCKPVSTQNTYLVCSGANDFAVVLGDGTKSRCTHCFASKSCRHVTAVAKNATTEASDDGSDGNEALEEGAEQFSTLDNLANEYLDAEGNLRIRSVSQVRVAWLPDSLLALNTANSDLVSPPFPRTPHVTPVCYVKEAIPGLFSGHPAHAMPGEGAVLRPDVPADSKPCTCGRCWRTDGKWLPAANRTTRDPILYGLTMWRTVSVEKLVCPCGAEIAYDGLGDGVLNLNNTDLFSHEVLRWYVGREQRCIACARYGYDTDTGVAFGMCRYSIQMATTATPFYAHWRTVVANYVATGLPPTRADWFLNKRSQ